MRILIAACLLVVATSSSVAPTSQRLRDRYGGARRRAVYRRR